MLPVAFDPDRPLVATSAFPASDRMVAAGEVFDWRAMGLPPIDVLAMVRSGLLTHPLELATAPPTKPKRKQQRTTG